MRSREWEETSSIIVVITLSSSSSSTAKFIKLDLTRGDLRRGVVSCSHCYSSFGGRAGRPERGRVDGVCKTL